MGWLGVYCLVTGAGVRLFALLDGATVALVHHVGVILFLARRWPVDQRQERASYDTSDPLQQEVTRVLKGFKNDIPGITFLGNDGVLRSLTADRKVLSAEGLSKPLLYENGQC